MLSERLPPLRAAGQTRVAAEEWELFSLAYLASYDGNATHARVYDAHQRAWGYDRLDIINRAAPDLPCAIAATYGTGTRRRIVVAIEGMRSMAQLLAIIRTDFLVTPTGLQGMVCADFDRLATAIIASLNARNVFQDSSLNQLDITLGGYSLGGAVATVMAQKLAFLPNQLGAQLITFGTPRVGTRHFLAARPWQIATSSYYIEQDPIWLIPTEMRQADFTTNFVPSAMRFALQAEEGRQGLRFDNGEPTPLTARNVFDALYDISDLARPMNRNNAWWYHQIFSYRQMMMNRLARRGVTLDYYRFRYLEYPNENNFQTLYAPGATMNYSDGVWSDGVAEVALPTTYSRAAVELGQREDPSIAGMTTDTWVIRANRRVEDNPGGPSNWNFVPAVQPARRIGRRNP